MKIILPRGAGGKVPACQYKIHNTRVAPWKKSYDRPRQHIRKQRHHFVNKGPSSQSCGLSSSHVWKWELDYKEIWVLKNWCFWTVVLEKTLKSPLDNKEIQPVHLKEISPEYSLEGLKTLESPLDNKEIQPVHLKEISPEYSLDGLKLKLQLQ